MIIRPSKSAESTRLYVLSALLVGAIFFAMWASEGRQGFASSELRFFETSSQGLQIVPASCPSYPHSGGDGNCSVNSYCSISASPSTVSSGGATTITWSSSYPGAQYVSLNDGAGQRAVSGNVVKYPTQTSFYVADVYTSGNTYVGSCSALVTVSDGPTSCSAQYYCVGSSLYFRTSACDTSYIQACAYGCAGGACLPDPGTIGDGDAPINIWVSPSLIRQGNTSVVSWTSNDMRSCTVSENNPTIANSWSGTSGSQVSSALSQQTTYTLSCVGLNNQTYTDAATVNIIPIFQEI